MQGDFVYSDIDISLFTAIKTFIIAKINSQIGADNNRQHATQ